MRSDGGALLAVPCEAMGAETGEALGAVVRFRLAYCLIGAAMIGLGVLLFADRDFCGVVGGLSCVVIGVAAFEAAIKGPR